MHAAISCSTCELHTDVLGRPSRLVQAISCVSGGGYTGGALVNWWRHHNRKAAEQRHDAALELDWMYELFERIVKPGNPLASCDTFCKVRSGAHQSRH